MYVCMFWDLCIFLKWWIYYKIFYLTGDLLSILGGKLHPRQISCSWAPLPYNTRGNGKSSDKWKHWKHYSCNHCKQILLFVTDSLSLCPSCIFVIKKKTSLTMSSLLIDILWFQETEMQSGCKEVLILLALYREITLTNGSLQRQNISEEVSKVR